MYPVGKDVNYAIRIIHEILAGPTQIRLVYKINIARDPAISIIPATGIRSVASGL